MFPGARGLLGSAGAGLGIAPALQAATTALAVVGGAFLARAWYLQIRHGVGGAWPLRSLLVLAASTTLAATLWGLRFGGVLGG